MLWLENCISYELWQLWWILVGRWLLLWMLVVFGYIAVQREAVVHQTRGAVPGSRASPGWMAEVTGGDEKGARSLAQVVLRLLRCRQLIDSLFMMFFKDSRWFTNSLSQILVTVFLNCHGGRKVITSHLLDCCCSGRKITFRTGRNLKTALLIRNGLEDRLRWNMYTISRYRQCPVHWSTAYTHHYSASRASHP